MTAFRRVLRDPLVHFLAAGGLLFAAWGLLGSPDARSADETTIIADKRALMEYMQYRSAAFEPEYFEQQWAAMPREEKLLLAQNYVREEAMAREARAMGLDRSDYVIRQRLLQKVLFLIDGSSARIDPPGEATLKAYFEQHRADYRGEIALTFTHVFVDDEKPHREGGLAAAQALLAQLRSHRAEFNDAPAYGDRFPYLQNYVNRGTGFIANQFGEEFAQAVAKLEPGESWHGPIRSQFGYHLVMLTAREGSEEPDFAALRDRVESDLMAERTEAARQAAIDELLDSYKVVIDIGDEAGEDG